MAEAATTTTEWSKQIQELGEKLVGLTVLEAQQLGDYLENVHGIKPAGGMVVAAMPGAGAEGGAAAEEEKTEFDVVLESFGEKKIEVIKIVRAATELGLKEAKELVEGAPKPVKSGVPKDVAEKLKADLESAGAKVTIK